MTEEVGPVYFGNVYKYGGVVFDQHFPLEWAKSDSVNRTGPYSCLNCQEFGVYRGSFIGYCRNCADMEYNYTRTSGFWDRGTANPVDGVESPFDTYLGGVTLEDIGLPLPIPLSRCKNVDVYSDEENQPRVSYSEIFDNIVPQTTFDKKDIKIQENILDQGFIFSGYGTAVSHNTSLSHHNDDRHTNAEEKQMDAEINDFSEIQTVRKQLENKTKQLNYYKRLWKADRRQINCLMELISALEEEIDR